MPCLETFQKCMKRGMPRRAKIKTMEKCREGMPEKRGNTEPDDHGLSDAARTMHAFGTDCKCVPVAGAGRRRAVRRRRDARKRADWGRIAFCCRKERSS